MRFRPRFSLRTLAVVVTLVCVYFGMWGPTKKYGIPTFSNIRTLDGNDEPFVLDAYSPSPLIVCQRESVVAAIFEDGATPLVVVAMKPDVRRYYLWLLGPKIRLPFESEWE